MASRQISPPGPSGRRPGRPRRDARHDSDSLIDWTQPDQNAHVLDWRQRAHEFGIVPADESDETVVLPARQLVEEDDPEAFDDQMMDEGDEPLRAETKRDDDEEEEEETPQPGPAREDLDLVRVYLKHVGRRKLLKAKEEQEIGGRIEQARGELQATLGMIPCAVRTLAGPFVDFLPPLTDAVEALENRRDVILPELAAVGSRADIQSLLACYAIASRPT